MCVCVRLHARMRMHMRVHTCVFSLFPCAHVGFSASTPSDVLTLWQSGFIQVPLVQLDVSLLSGPPSDSNGAVSSCTYAIRLNVRMEEEIMAFLDVHQVSKRRCIVPVNYFARLAAMTNPYSLWISYIISLNIAFLPSF
jgi:hypothetical protein